MPDLYLGDNTWQNDYQPNAQSVLVVFIDENFIILCYLPELADI